MEPRCIVSRRWRSTTAEVALMATDPGYASERRTCPDPQYWLLLRGAWSDQRETRAREIVGGRAVLYRPRERVRRESLEPTLGLGVRLLSPENEGMAATLGWSARRSLWHLARAFAAGENDPGRLDELAATLLNPAPVPEPSAPRWLRQVRERVRAGDEASLGELARVAGVSPAHLSASFARAYGAPISLVRRRLQIERAARELGGRPLGEAAVEAGFYDASHFDRACRSELGLRPRELLDLVRFDP